MEGKMWDIYFDTRYSIIFLYCKAATSSHIQVYLYIPLLPYSEDLIYNHHCN